MCSSGPLWTTSCVPWAPGSRCERQACLRRYTWHRGSWERRGGAAGDMLHAADLEPPPRSPSAATCLPPLPAPCRAAGGRVHRLPGQVRRPPARPPRQGRGGAVAPVPRGVLPLRGASGAVRGRVVVGGACARLQRRPHAAGHASAGPALASLCRGTLHAAAQPAPPAPPPPPVSLVHGFFVCVKDLQCLWRDLAQTTALCSGRPPVSSLLQGSYVKDLQCLGRDLAQTIIVDNSPHSYMFQPENALPIGTFIDDMQDQVCVWWWWWWWCVCVWWWGWGAPLLMT